MNVNSILLQLFVSHPAVMEVNVLLQQPANVQVNTQDIAVKTLLPVGIPLIFLKRKFLFFGQLKYVLLPNLDG